MRLMMVAKIALTSDGNTLMMESTLWKSMILS